MVCNSDLHIIYLGRTVFFMSLNLKLDDILKAKVGMTKELSASFRRVINVGNYETKTYEQSMSVELDREVTGAERDVALAVLQAQLEYNCTAKMFIDGDITEQDYRNTVTSLEVGINALTDKVIKCGIDVTDILRLATDEGGDAVTTTLTQTVNN